MNSEGRRNRDIGVEGLLAEYVLTRCFAEVNVYPVCLWTLPFTMTIWRNAVLIRNKFPKL